MIRFLSILAVVPFFLIGRIISLPARSLVFLLLLPSIYALSNISSPGLWAIFVTAASILSMFVGILFSKYDRNALFVIDAVLGLHVIFLSLQALIFLTKNTLVEPHNWLFPASDSRSGFHLDVLRLGGAHIEPGTYANYMFLLLVMRTCLGGALNDRISVLTGVTLALTFSAWGILASSVYFAAVLAQEIFVKRAVGAGVFLAASIGLLVLFAAYWWGHLDWAINYFEVRFDITQGSAGSRKETWDAFLTSIDRFLVIGMPEAVSFCEMCQSPQDLGLWSQLVVRLGLFVAIAVFVFVIVASWRQTLSLQFMISFSFSGKYTLSDPVVWVFLMVLLAPLWNRRGRRDS